METLVETRAFRLESKSCKDFFLQINFSPIEFIRDHVTFKLPYDFSYHMKTPLDILGSFIIMKRSSSFWVLEPEILQPKLLYQTVDTYFINSVLCTCECFRNDHTSTHNLTWENLPLFQLCLWPAFYETFLI